MDNNTRKKNANRLVYITVVVIICVMTVLIGITSALNRSNKPSEPSETSAPESSSALPPATSRPSVTSRVTTPATTTAPAAVTTPSAEQVNTKDDELPVFIMPVIGNIAKDYDLSTLVYSLTMNDYRVHAGIDIAASVGDAVYCVADGVIEQVWNDPLMGRCISVSHSGNAVSIYKNLAPELAQGIVAGASVWGGEVIGSVGESAVIELADEPHLHFEMKVGGIYADPLDYLPAEAVSAMIATDTSYEDQ